MLLESLFHLLFFGFGICIDMDNEVIEDDDDINLESFGDEFNAPPRFRDKIILFKLKMKKMRMRMMIMMLVVEHLV